MDKVRLFTGTFVDSDIFDFIYNDIFEDFSNVITGKWVEPENLHFTWHFIGETESGLARELKNAISSKLTLYDSPIVFKGLGTFPDSRHPKVLFASMKYDKVLFQKLYNEINALIKEFGYKPETRPFTPHLTFIRIREVIDRNEFHEKLKAYGDRQFGFMESFRLNLIESRLTPKGPEYKFF